MVPQCAPGGRVAVYLFEGPGDVDVSGVLHDMFVHTSEYEKKKMTNDHRYKKEEKDERKGNEGEGEQHGTNNGARRGNGGKEGRSGERLKNIAAVARKVLQLMVDDVANVPPECVVFNWECSSGYSDEGFGSPKQTESVYALLDILVQRGYFAMFSDFALKALIGTWQENLLGRWVREEEGGREGGREKVVKE